MAKIAVDAGHYLYTPGKRCLKALDPKETREWVMNNIAATEFCRLMEAAGHQTKRVDDITGKHDVSLAERVRKANAWGADVYASFHQNAAGIGRIFTGGGTEVYVCPGCQRKSIQLQEAVYEHAIARTGLKGNRSDGTRTKSLYVLNNTNMPAFLIECGFMDSEVDIKYILDPEWQKLNALGVAEGVCSVIGGRVSASAPAKPATPVKAESVDDKLEVDGKFGRDTITKSQIVFKTYVDGKISNQPAVNKEYLPNAVSGPWEFEAEYADYRKGSEFIRETERFFEAKGFYLGEIDGWAGEQYVMAMELFLKSIGLYDGEIDGSMGPKCVSGWQQYINSRL